MIRSLCTAPQYMPILARHVRQLQDDGRKVVLITFNRPYEQLKQALRQQGVRADEVFYLDSTGWANGHTAFLPDAMFVSSPSQLEGVTMRARLICQRLGPAAHVVLDSVNVVAQHNSVAGAQEFTRLLGNALRAGDVGVDFMVLHTTEAERLCDALAPTVDRHEHLHAAA